jgi:hypothetical protein
MGKAIKAVGVSHFKANCHALLEQVHVTKKPLSVTRFGKPIADILPSAKVCDRSLWIGSMTNSFCIRGDIVSPATDPDDWECLRD